MAPGGVGAGDGAAALPHYFLPVLIDGRVVGGGTAEVTSRFLSLSCLCTIPLSWAQQFEFYGGLNSTAEVLL